MAGPKTDAVQPGARLHGPDVAGPHLPSESWIYSPPAADIDGKVFEPQRPSRLPAPGELVRYQMPWGEMEVHEWDPRQAETDGWHWEIAHDDKSSFWARVPDIEKVPDLVEAHQRAEEKWDKAVEQRENKQAMLDVIKPGVDMSALTLQAPSGRAAYLGALGLSSTLGGEGVKVVFNGQGVGGFDSGGAPMYGVAGGVKLQLPVNEQNVPSGRGNGFGVELGAQFLALSQPGFSEATYALPFGGVFFKADEVVVNLSVGAAVPMKAGIPEGAKDPVAGSDKANIAGMVNLTLPLSKAEPQKK